MGLMVLDYLKLVEEMGLVNNIPQEKLRLLKQKDQAASDIRNMLSVDQLIVAREKFKEKKRKFNRDLFWNELHDEVMKYPNSNKSQIITKQSNMQNKNSTLSNPAKRKLPVEQTSVQSKKVRLSVL